MVKSMTGFGRFEKVTEEYKLSVEMKAVNHRYLDLNIKMPKRFGMFEAAIRNLIKKYAQRGKIDIFINYEDYSDGNMCLKYNHTLAAEYLGYLSRMQEEFAIPNDITAVSLSRMPEVITMEQEADDEERLWQRLSEVLSKAAERFAEARTLEGEQLKQDLVSKLDSMILLVDEIEARSPQLLAEYRQKLEDKVKELLGNTSLDEGRIAAEVVIYADKICTDEETVRLRSHITNMRNKLVSGGGIGRELDFVAQEMNREANTILSKANDLEISQKAISLKTEIEKVREQIQNIE